MEKVFKKDFVYQNITYFKKDQKCNVTTEIWKKDNNTTFDIVLVGEWYVSNEYFYTDKELRKIKLKKLKKEI